MANLVITSHKGGVKFEGNGVETVFNGFSTKRYSGQNKLDIIGNTKDNYATFTIIFPDYDTITVNGIAATNADNLQDLLDEISSSGVMDVALQDQHTRAIILPFNKVTNSTTLSALGVLGEYTITVTSTTGFSDGSFIILFNSTSKRYNFFYQVGAAAGNVITLDSPLDYAYEVGTNVDVAITNMAVNGSVTPQVFGLRGVGSPPGVDITFDMTRIIFEAITTSPVDLSKFANFLELTRGLLFRTRDGIYNNIFNVKTNGEIAGIMYDWNPRASTNPVQGVDGFVSRLTFASQGKIGVTIRLPVGEDAEFVVQDDLLTAQSGETITKFKIIAEGHIVD